MDRANQDIRDALKKSGVKQWELAERRGISEGWLCKAMRHELAEDEKKILLSMIREIADERKGLESDAIQNQIKRLEMELAMLKGETK